MDSRSNTPIKLGGALQFLGLDRQVLADEPGLPATKPAPGSSGPMAVHTALWQGSLLSRALHMALLLAFALSIARTLRKVDLRWKHRAFAVTLALAGFAAAVISQDAHKEKLLWVFCGYAVELGLRHAARLSDNAA